MNKATEHVHSIARCHTEAEAKQSYRGRKGKLNLDYTPACIRVWADSDLQTASVGCNEHCASASTNAESLRAQTLARSTPYPVNATPLKAHKQSSAIRERISERLELVIPFASGRQHAS